MPNSAQNNAYYGALSTGQGVLTDALGNVIAVGVTMPAGAASGYTLTSDAAGVLTLKPAQTAGVFGTGTDGAVTFDGSATVLGLTPSSQVYTLTRDIHCTSITINSGVTVKPAYFRIFCRGTVTNNGTISNTGNNAAGNTAGGASPSGSFASGRAGGNGGTGVSGTGANGTGANLGANGGNGGAGTSGAAGTGGVAGAVTANISSNLLQTPTGLLTGVIAYANGVSIVGWGSGGGGGGSDASSNAGGGGGGGGGIVAIFAWAVNNGSGTITVAGGNGAAGTGGNAGGGGGGSGGLIAAYTLSAWTAGTTNVVGGIHGNGVGTGSAGVDGGVGLALNVVIG